MITPRIYESKYARNATFQVSGRDMITIYQFQELSSDDWRPAGVNWSACGTVSAEIATEFMEVLAKAIKLAETWTAEKSRLDPAGKPTK